MVVGDPWRNGLQYVLCKGSSRYNFFILTKLSRCLDRATWMLFEFQSSNGVLLLHYRLRWVLLIGELAPVKVSRWIELILLLSIAPKIGRALNKLRFSLLFWFRQNSVFNWSVMVFHSRCPGHFRPCQFTHTRGTSFFLPLCYFFQGMVVGHWFSKTELVLAYFKIAPVSTWLV